eukprot:6658827-Alexandrium_andersonii.AAC.1
MLTANKLLSARGPGERAAAPSHETGRARRTRRLPSSWGAVGGAGRGEGTRERAGAEPCESST